MPFNYNLLRLSMFLWYKFCKQMCVTQMSPLIQSHPNDGIIYYEFLMEYVWNSA